MTARERGAAERQQPGEAERREIEAAAHRVGTRCVPPKVEFVDVGGQLGVRASHSDDSGFVARHLDLFGTSSMEFAAVQMGMAEWSARERDKEMSPDNSPVALNASLALISAVAPENELEAALAVQMAGTHALTCELLGRAKTTGDVVHLETYTKLAMKMQRTFMDQLETLGRLRGKGQQTVRVEHVNVHPGGQAIVGDVHHHPAPGGRVHQNIEERPHAPAHVTFEPGAPMHGEDPARCALPSAEHAER